MKHTQGKLEVLNNYVKKIGGGVIATTARNNAICRFEAVPGSLEDAANAEFIARAWNSHYELLESLKQTVTSLEYWFLSWGDPLGANSKIMQNARAVIQKANRRE